MNDEDATVRRPGEMIVLDDHRIRQARPIILGGSLSSMHHLVLAAAASVGCSVVEPARQQGSMFDYLDREYRAPIRERRGRRSRPIDRVIQLGRPKDLSEFIYERPLTKRQRRRERGKK